MPKLELEDVADAEGGLMNRRERAYKCQRCLNHNRLVSRKGHQCPYKDCFCAGCDLNNLRSKLMTVLRERGLNHTEVFMTKKAGRKQHCMLCSFHGERIELRGHKRLCPWAKCECTLCTIGRHYRDTMAKQTKHRRSQRRPGPGEKAAMGQEKGEERSSVPKPSKRVIMKGDWRRRVQASRWARRATGSVDNSGESDSERCPDNVDPGAQTETRVTSAQADTTTERSPISARWNGRRTPDQDVLKHLGLLQHPQVPLWPGSMSSTPTNICGFYNSPLRQSASLLNASASHSHPPHAANMASHIAAQQREATDLALAFLWSRYSSLASSIFPTTPGFCLSCQQGAEVNPLPGAACHQGHAVPKVDHYLNALREYTHLPVVASRPVLPTILHPADVWPPAPVFFK